jgi:hypothetical protein
MHRPRTATSTELFGMTNLNDNSEASAFGTRPTFGYKLNLLSFYLFIFNSSLNMNMHMACLTHDNMHLEIPM